MSDHLPLSSDQWNALHKAICETVRQEMRAEFEARRRLDAAAQEWARFCASMGRDWCQRFFAQHRGSYPNLIAQADKVLED